MLLPQQEAEKAHQQQQQQHRSLSPCEVTAVAFSEGAELLAAGFASGAIVLWDVSSYKWKPPGNSSSQSTTASMGQGLGSLVHPPVAIVTGKHASPVLHVGFTATGASKAGGSAGDSGTAGAGGGGAGGRGEGKSGSGSSSKSSGGVAGKVDSGGMINSALASASTNFGMAKLWNVSVSGAASSLVNQAARSFAMVTADEGGVAVLHSVTVVPLFRSIGVTSEKVMRF